MKKKNRHGEVTDAVKAMRKGNREAEMELLGPGFHRKHSIHKSANIYTRKEKHKSKISNDSPCASLFVLRKRNVKKKQFCDSIFCLPFLVFFPCYQKKINFRIGAINFFSI